MTAISTLSRPRPLARPLAVLSVLGFWALPFSPFVAIGAVALTRGTLAWPRRWAVAGATLCAAHTLLMAAAVAALAWRTWHA